MADATTVSVLLQAKDQASPAIDKVEGKMGKLAANFGKHRQKIGMAAAGIGAGIAAIGVTAMKSFQEEQIGIGKLDAALKGAGSSYDAQKKSIEAVVAAQQNKTNFGDEQQRDALRQLILASGDYEQSIKVLPALLDTAAGSGKSLEGVALAVGRAIGGEPTALKGFGVTLDNTAGPLEVITALQQKFGGQAEASADPRTQLTNRLGDLSQEFGKVLLPIMEAILPPIERFIRRVIEWTSAHPELTKVLFLTAAAVGAIALVVGPLLIVLPLLAGGFTMVAGAIGLIGTVAMGPAGLVIAAVGLLAVALGPTLLSFLGDWTTGNKDVARSLDGLSVATDNLAEKNIRSLEDELWRVTKQTQEALKETEKFEGGMAVLKMGFFGAAKGAKEAEKNYQALQKRQDALAKELRQRVIPAWVDTEEELVQFKLSQESLERVVQSSTDTINGSYEETASVVRKSVEVATSVLSEYDTAIQEAGDTTTQTHRVIVGSYEELQKAIALHGKDFLTMMGEEERAVKEWEEKMKASIDEVGFHMDELGNSSKDNARLVAEAAEAATKTMEKNFDDFMTSMDRQEQQLGEVFSGMTDEMDFFAGPQMDAWLDTQKEKLGKSNDQLDTWSERQKKTLEEAGETRRELEDRTYAAGLDKFAAYIKAQEDIQQAAADAERQKMVEKFKATPQFASMSAQQEKLRSVQHALVSQEGALPGMREAINQAKAGLQEYRGTGYGASQRSDQYWKDVVMPVQDQYQRQVERIRATKNQIANLENQIGQNVIPDVYKGISENVLANEWMRPMQGGGISTGGLALGGERGPEIVSLPGGARVHPSGTGPGSNQFHFHGAVYGLEDLRRVVVEAVRDHALSGGFRGVFGEA